MIPFGEESLRTVVREFIRHITPSEITKASAIDSSLLSDASPFTMDPFDARAVLAECLTTMTELPDDANSVFG
jgi:hypothetical protein